MLHHVRQDLVVLVAAILAPLTNPVDAARLARVIVVDRLLGVLLTIRARETLQWCIALHLDLALQHDLGLLLRDT